MKHIIFIDVAGYTESIDKDHVRTKRLIETYDYLIKGKIGTLSGEIIQSAGDGYYIQFPATEKPIKIINCLKSIVESISEFKDYLAIRIGYHFADIDSDTKNDVNINLAQRLESSAHPSQINISESVFNLIKQQEHQFIIKEEKIDLKGLGENKIYRIKVINDEGNKKEYKIPNLPEVTTKEIIAEYDEYSVRILVDEKKNVTMIDVAYNDGDSFYTELDESGFSKIKLNSGTSYKINLPPQEDLLERNEKRENEKLIVTLQYKWNAKVTLVYNMNQKLETFSSENSIISFSNKTKTIEVKYKFSENPLKYNYKKSN